MSSFFRTPSRVDICHKHHKQPLCKLILTLNKISHSEFFLYNFKDFFHFFLKLICLSEESTYFKRTVSDYLIFGVQMPKIGSLGVIFFSRLTHSLGKFSYMLASCLGR